MKEILKSTLKRASLELIYDVVDERTREINSRLDRLEDDMRELRGEINRRFEAVDQRFAAMDQKFDAINGRLDQIFSILATKKSD